MRTTLLSLLALLLPSSFAAATKKYPVIPPPAPAGTLTTVADLAGDGRRERIVVDPRRDPALSVWLDGHLAGQAVERDWRPWKLRTANILGNGHRQIVVGVYKTTRYFPFPHNCLYVYSWTGKEMVPRWRGSSLALRYLDFEFGHLDGGPKEQLVAVEQQLDGKQCIECYEWSGFGFSSLWRHGDWESVHIVSIAKGRVTVRADGKIWGIGDRG